MLLQWIQDPRKVGDALTKLAHRGEADLDRVAPAVSDILLEVKTRGLDGLLARIKQFENRIPNPLVLGPKEIDQVASKTSPEAQAVLIAAHERIRAYHQRQKGGAFLYEEGGVTLGQRITALRSVGVYAPGGKARYPSSVLMAAGPAQVAGVTHLTIATPDPTPEIAFAARLCGAQSILNAGGAHAIAALAYGVEGLPRVDKIVGPGNIFVACAKKQVFGMVDIDSIAGPSEILIIADQRANPHYIAADLLSQAEHDEDAYPLLILVAAPEQTGALIQNIEAALSDQLNQLPRHSIANASLKANGYAFVVQTLDEAAAISNQLAPEHLSLQVAEPDTLEQKIQYAGAVFVGDHTPEAAGDYFAGPSHVLPTGGAARFASPLGVHDFIVRRSFIKYSAGALSQQSGDIARFARLEGLEAHARAAEIRQK